MASASRIHELLAAARRLPDIPQRQVAALLGACVADAAARPLHWVYNMRDLEGHLRSGLGGVDRHAEPEFFPENRSPFYSIPTGMNSCYFDITLAVMHALNARRAAVGELYDLESLCAALDERFFGPNTEYSVAKRREFMANSQDTSADDPAAVLDGKWLHGSLLAFHDNRAGGRPLRELGDPKIKETDGFCASLPLAVVFATRPDGDAWAEAERWCADVSSTQSRWPVTVEHGVSAVRVVRRMILTGGEAAGDWLSVEQDACEDVDAPDAAASIQYVKDTLGVPHEKAVGDHYGRPCYNPGSYQGALHAVATTDNFADAVRATIRAGGCNCSRAVLIGAVAGARYGLAGIPEAWVERADSAAEVLEAAMALVAA